MSDIQAKLDYADAIAEWFLDLGETHIRADRLEEAMKCLYVAGFIFSRQNRTLVSARLEAALRLIANCLAKQDGLRKPAAAASKPNGKETCLHVLSEALPAGGLTAMAVRWINNDRSGRIHNVALLSGGGPAPAALRQAVEATEGTLYTANPADSWLERAVWLRHLAHDLAACVILHVSPSDVVSGVAFGSSGGPPVLLVNHTAHTFWIGASIADAILNVRGSALEQYWTAIYRGNPCCAILPIPLEEPLPSAVHHTHGVDRRSRARQRWDLPEHALVIITVGASFKYLPTEGLDFLKTCERFLKEIPDAYLLTVGFHADSRWENTSRRWNARIRALGTLSRSELASVHEAADIYIEGFPFGTTTSLLEAGIRGIPVVLAPVQCPPPYGSDGVALDAILDRPSSVENYIARIIDLSHNPGERAVQGGKLRESIIEHHAGPGWTAYLDAALTSLPDEHAVYELPTPPRTPEDIHEYWASFMARIDWGYEQTLEHMVGHALSIGLRPRLTGTVLRACAKNGSVNGYRGIPLPVARFLCNWLLPAMPARMAYYPFRFISFICRPSLLRRARLRVLRLFGSAAGPGGMYEEYRKVREPAG
jgi:glycosyltransferase involved in cell wall biosynthesis